MSKQGPLRKLKQYLRRNKLAREGVKESLYIEKLELGQGSGAWICSLNGLTPASRIYSFGAGTDISFDLDVHARSGAEVHIFDPTPRSIEWIGQQQLPQGVSFHAYGIGAEDGSIEFYPPRRTTSSHFSPVRRYAGQQYGDPVQAPVYCLSSIMAMLGHDHVDMIKLDIEGGEFDVIEHLADPGNGAGQLLIEFHHNYQTIPLSNTVNSFKKIENSGFHCFHISDRTYEMSFIRQ